MKGNKYDSGKIRWSLVDFRNLEGMVRVLEFGAKKYGEQNWRKVDDGERRYQDAALRHLLSLLGGEAVDPETGESHYDHALCSIAFARWHHKNKGLTNGKRSSRIR